MPCDGKGCETACCFGCKCCEERAIKIKQLEAELVKFNSGSQGKYIKHLQSELKIFEKAKGELVKASEALIKNKREVEEENKTLKKENRELKANLKTLESLVSNIKQTVNETNAYLINDNKHKQIIKQKITELKGKIEIRG